MASSPNSIKESCAHKSFVQSLIEMTQLEGISGDFRLIDESWLIVYQYYHVLWDISYQVPILYVSLNAPNINQILMPNSSDQDHSMNFSLRISIGEHPRLLMPALVVHTCDTFDWIKVTSSSQTLDECESTMDITNFQWTPSILYAWMSFVGPSVGLKLPAISKW